jgi:hypothetical protein
MTDEYMIDLDEATTLSDTDEMLVTTDIATIPVSKFTKWSTIKSVLKTYFDTLYTGLDIHALTGKTTPVDADELVITDSASSYANKKLTWANTKATLKTYFDTLYGSGGASEGSLVNGKFVVSVTSNNITLALKTLAGSDPSSVDPVKIIIDGVQRTITSALSVTKNAGTNWFNSGSTELATKLVNYFIYIGYNATDGVVIGFSRIPYALSYSEFSTTSTNEKYAAISTITNATSTDTYINHGRFSATLSASASYNWSISGSGNVINRPIEKTNWLDWNSVITYSGGTTDPTSNTISVAKYRIDGRGFYCNIQSTLVVGSGNRVFTTFSVPFTFSAVTPVASLVNISGVGLKNSSGTYFSSNGFIIVETMSSNGNYYGNGFATLG